MTKKHCTIIVPQDIAEKITDLLAEQPKCEDECFTETITYTAKFDDEYEVDVKLCGVDYIDGEDNRPYTEAVLFKNNAQVCCTEPYDEFFGEWGAGELETDDMMFIVNVVAETSE